MRVLPTVTLRQRPLSAKTVSSAFQTREASACCKPASEPP